MKIQLNSLEIEIRTDSELSQFLDRIDAIEKLEGLVKSKENRSLSILKSGDEIFLMYIEFPGDEGVVTGSHDVDSKLIEFRLANGQVDEYPQSWCIEKEAAYKAIAYFLVNSGERSPHIAWHTA